MDQRIFDTPLEKALKDLSTKTTAKSPKHLLDQIKMAAYGLREARQSSAALHNCLDSIEDAAQNAYYQKTPLKKNAENTQ